MNNVRNIDLKSMAETGLKYLTVSTCVLAAQFAASRVPPAGKSGWVSWVKSSTAVIVGVIGSGLLINYVETQKVLKISSATKSQKLIESNL